MLKNGREELLRRSAVAINGLQRIMGGELDISAPQEDANIWVEAENLLMAINAELNPSPDLLWLMMRQRGAVQMKECIIGGTDFSWPYQHCDDTHDRPYDLESLVESLSKVGLKVDESFRLSGRGWGRWRVRVSTK